MGARWRFEGGWLTTVSGEGRTGTIAPASARISDLRFALGFGRAFALGRRASTSLRLDGVYRETITRTPEDETLSCFVPGGALVGDADLRLFDQLFLTASVGAEVVVGETRILVGRAPITAMPAFRGIGALGLRLSF